MSDKPTAVGTITIQIFEGGVKEAHFKGRVEPNDILSCKITMQTDYAKWLNEQYLQSMKDQKENVRVQAERDAAENEKALKIQQEKDAAEQKKADAVKVAEAKVAELKESLKGEEDEVKVKKIKRDLERAQAELVRIKK